jgi:predicted ABC-type transport system involved in lysophospholipase L1 biosynthesis ATPase subunit
MVTHDVDMAQRADRRVALRDGRVVEDVVRRDG